MLAKSEIQRDALNLPAQERIELVVELWDSLAPGEIPVPDWQRDLIRDRLAALEDLLPEARSVPWEAVRQRMSQGLVDRRQAGRSRRTLE